MRSEASVSSARLSFMRIFVSTASVSRPPSLQRAISARLVTSCPGALPSGLLCLITCSAGSEEHVTVHPHAFIMSMTEAASRRALACAHRLCAGPQIMTGAHRRCGWRGSIRVHALRAWCSRRDAAAAAVSCAIAAGAAAAAAGGADAAGAAAAAAGRVLAAASVPAAAAAAAVAAAAAGSRIAGAAVRRRAAAARCAGRSGGVGRGAERGQHRVSRLSYRLRVRVGAVRRLGRRRAAGGLAGVAAGAAGPLRGRAAARAGVAGGRGRPARRRWRARGARRARAAQEALPQAALQAERVLGRAVRRLRPRGCSASRRVEGTTEEEPPWPKALSLRARALLRVPSRLPYAAVHSRKPPSMDEPGCWDTEPWRACLYLAPRAPTANDPPEPSTTSTGGRQPPAREAPHLRVGAGRVRRRRRAAVAAAGQRRQRGRAGRAGSAQHVSQRALVPGAAERGDKLHRGADRDLELQRRLLPRRGSREVGRGIGRRRRRRRGVAARQHRWLSAVSVLALSVRVRARLLTGERLGGCRGRRCRARRTARRRGSRRSRAVRCRDCGVPARLVRVRSQTRLRSAVLHGSAARGRLRPRAAGGGMRRWRPLRRRRRLLACSLACGRRRRLGASRLLSQQLRARRAVRFRERRRGRRRGRRLVVRGRAALAGRARSRCVGRQLRRVRLGRGRPARGARPLARGAGARAGRLQAAPLSEGSQCSL